MINYMARRGAARNERYDVLGRLDVTAARGSVILIGVIYIAVKTVDTPRLSRPCHAELPCFSVQLDTWSRDHRGSIRRLAGINVFSELMNNDCKGKTAKRVQSHASRNEPSCRVDGIWTSTDKIFETDCVCQTRILGTLVDVCEAGTSGLWKCVRDAFARWVRVQWVFSRVKGRERV